MSRYPHKISKSRFVSGAQCQKKLYFDLFRKDLKSPVTPQQQALFNTGHEIGHLAQQVFPGGIDLSPETYYDFSDAIDQTREAINKGQTTIYEAAFYHEEVLAALDILHHQDGERWAIEVKSSTSVKDYHLQDAALQYWVMAQSGFTPDKFFLMHINNAYVKQGPIDPKALFTLSDITTEVKEKQAWVAEQIPSLKSLQANQEPDIPIGKHCDAPFECDYKPHCWKHIPSKDSVFELKNARGKDWELYEQGILHLADVPPDFKLSVTQQMQVEGVKFGSSFIRKEPINEFLETISYPVYYFDFETINSAIPILDGTKPFQQVPFQYSLHRVSAPGESAEHTPFLANPLDFTEKGEADPLQSLINRLKTDFQHEGTILAYNAVFEKTVLKALATAYPEDAEFIHLLTERFVDLMDVFKQGWYVTTAMQGSYSIKYVLPALFPELSYDNLAIGNGADASNTFLSMIVGSFTGNETLTRKQLLQYCEQDTYAMVLLHKELLRVSYLDTDE
jgi:predicted RecB family nuclease